MRQRDRQNKSDVRVTASRPGSMLGSLGMADTVVGKSLAGSLVRSQPGIGTSLPFKDIFTLRIRLKTRSGDDRVPKPLIPFCEEPVEVVFEERR